MAKKPPGVHVVKRKHTTTYYFRRRIPAELLAHYPDAQPAGWITKKLPPAQADAYARAAQRWAEVEAEFRQLRETGSRFRPTLTEAEKDFIFRSARHDLLDADDGHWRFRPDEGSDEAYGYRLSDLFEEVTAGLSPSAQIPREIRQRIGAARGQGRRSHRLCPLPQELRAIVRLERIGVAAASAWALAAGAQPITPNERPLHDAGPGVTALQSGASLADAIDAAWQRSVLSAQAAGQARVAQAQRTTAFARWPAPRRCAATASNRRLFRSGESLEPPCNFPLANPT